MFVYMLEGTGMYRNHRRFHQPWNSWNWRKNLLLKLFGVYAGIFLYFKKSRTSEITQHFWTTILWNPMYGWSPSMKSSQQFWFFFDRAKVPTNVAPPGWPWVAQSTWPLQTRGLTVRFSNRFDVFGAFPTERAEVTRSPWGLMRPALNRKSDSIGDRKGRCLVR